MEQERQQPKSVIVSHAKSERTDSDKYVKDVQPNPRKYWHSKKSGHISGISDHQDKSKGDTGNDSKSSHRFHHHHEHHRQSQKYYHHSQDQHQTRQREGGQKPNDDILETVKSIQQEIRRHRAKPSSAKVVKSRSGDTLIAEYHRDEGQSTDMKEIKKHHRIKRSQYHQHDMKDSIKSSGSHLTLETKLPFTSSKKSSRWRGEIKSEGQTKITSYVKTSKDSVEDEPVIPIVEQLFKCHATRISLGNDRSSLNMQHTTSSPVMQPKSAFVVNKLFTTSVEKQANQSKTVSSVKMSQRSEKSMDYELEEGEIVESDTRSADNSKAIAKKRKKRSRSHRRNSSFASTMSDIAVDKLSRQTPNDVSKDIFASTWEDLQKRHQKEDNHEQRADKRKVEEQNSPKYRKTNAKTRHTDSKPNTGESPTVGSTKFVPVAYLSKAVKQELSVGEINNQKSRSNPEFSEEGEVGSTSDPEETSLPCLSLPCDNVPSPASSDMSISSDSQSNRDSSSIIEYVDSSVVIFTQDNGQNIPGTSNSELLVQTDPFETVADERNTIKNVKFSSWDSRNSGKSPAFFQSNLSSWCFQPSRRLETPRSSTATMETEKTSLLPDGHQNIEPMDLCNLEELSPWTAVDRIEKWPTATRKQSAAPPTITGGFVKGSVFAQTLSMMNHTTAGVVQRPTCPIPSYSNIIRQGLQAHAFQSRFLPSVSSSNSTSRDLILSVSQNAFPAPTQFGKRWSSTKSSHKGIKIDWSDGHCEEISGTPRRWETVSSPGKMTASMDFTVMSYNILSQDLLDRHLDLYSRCREEDLEWENRGPALLRQIIAHNSDIVCLQEVQEDHWHLDMKSILFQHGYEGIYKQKSGNKSDGCAILFKRDKFKQLKVVPVDFMKGGILDRDNVGIIMLLQPNPEVYGGKVQKICVATTHLLFNPKRGDIKLAQLMVLLAEIDKHAYIEDLQEQRGGEGIAERATFEQCNENSEFSAGPSDESRGSNDSSGMSKSTSREEEEEMWDSTRRSSSPQTSSSADADEVGGKSESRSSSPQYCPIVLCGDFNSEPISELYQFITSGYLRYVGLIARLVSGQREGRYGGMDRQVSKHLLPKHLAIGERCQYLDVVENRQKEKGWKPRRSKLNSGEMFHCMNFQSTYGQTMNRGGAREVSTFHCKSACVVDYIFYSSGIEDCQSSSESTKWGSLGTQERCPQDSWTCEYTEGRESPSGHEGTKEPLPNRCESDSKDSQANQSSLFDKPVEKSLCPDEPLQLLARYKLLTARQASNIGCMPNAVFPSDHLCLIAKFLLK